MFKEEESKKIQFEQFELRYNCFQVKQLIENDHLINYTKSNDTLSTIIKCSVPFLVHSYKQGMSQEV